MKCPECQTENPETRKFCRECGAKLICLCPQCGSENLPGDKFCGECGQELEGVKEAEKAIPAIEGERKHVTVLFSDLSGYTALSERLDPEDVKGITSRIFGEVAQVIHKYEGFVEKYAAGADEILVGQEVFRQALGHFDFETKGSIQAKGKSEPVLAYRVVAPKEKPVSLHGLSILRSELIGRKAEMEDLIWAVKELGQGNGSIFSISGEAGTGKSRLVEEFKAGLSNDEIQWLEGHKRFEERERKWCIGLTEVMLGQFYLQVATRGGEAHLPLMLKSLPFLVAKLPFAANKAKQHFLNCIEISEKIGAQSLAGEAYMSLGLWHKSKGRKEEAEKSFSEAIRRFEKGELKGPLQQAKEAMASLE